MFDVVHDRYFGVACENEVAVHAVDGEVRGDSELGGCEALGDYSTAVYATGSWGMPEGAGVGEHILRLRRLVRALEMAKEKRRAWYIPAQWQTVRSARGHSQLLIWRDQCPLV